MEVAPPDPNLGPAALRVVSEVVGVPTEGLGLAWIPAGVMTQKFIVKAAEEWYVVRFYPPSRAFVAGYEPDLLTRCREAGARVPEVVVDSRTGPPVDWPYVVYRYLPGDVLSERAAMLSASRWRGLAREIGSEIAKLRVVRFAGFGELETAWRARDASWAEFVRREFAQGLEAAASANLFPSQWLAEIGAVAADLGRWDLAAAPGLVWSDFHFGNILVDGTGHLAGLIDFEGALSGDALATLGYGFARYGHSQQYDSLLAAWPEPLGSLETARIALYAWLRVMRIAPYARRPLPAGGERRPLKEYFKGLEAALEALHARR